MPDPGALTIGEAVVAGAIPRQPLPSGNRLPNGEAATRSERFSIEDFRVPRDYLALIAGSEASEALLASAQGWDSSTECLSTVSFVDLCLRHFRSNFTESWSDAPEVRFGTFCLIVAAAAQGTSFHDALDRAAGALDILRPELSVKVRQNRLSLALTVAPRKPSLANEVGVEFLVLSLHCAFRWLTGSRLRPIHVRTAEAVDGHKVTMLNILACPVVRRGTGVTAHYDVADGRKPLEAKKYDRWATQELPEFHALLREFADEINAHARIAESPLVACVDDLLERGLWMEASVAASLNMSTASLRRHLAGCGTSFRARLDHKRRSIAHTLLLTDTPLEAIVTEAGFSDVRSLRRACIRWFGVPPGSYRPAARAIISNGRANR